MIDEKSIYFKRYSFFKKENKKNLNKIKSKIEIIDSNKIDLSVNIKNTEKDLITLINNYVKK